MFKGQMIRKLKSIGVRTGDKNGAIVKLEHLKTSDVIKVYKKYFQ